MGSVGDDLLGREVIDSQRFHNMHINTELNCAFQIVFALHYVVDVNSLDIFS